MSSTPVVEIVGDPEIEQGIVSLRGQVESLVVRDQSDFIKIATLETQAKDFIKRWENVYKEPLRRARNAVDGLRNDRARRTSEAQQIFDIAKKKGDEWKEQERAAAERERQREQERLRVEAQQRADAERRENERLADEQRKAREKEIEAQRKSGELKAREAEKQRKQAEADAKAAKELAAKQAAETAANVPIVEVKANIPTVAGKKNQVYYGADVVDGNAIVREFLMAPTPERRAFLRRFIQVDEMEVGRYARDTKDPKAVEAVLPGVKAWAKG